MLDYLESLRRKPDRLMKYLRTYSHMHHSVFNAMMVVCPDTVMPVPRCVMIKQFSLSDSDASITLIDPSGEMMGTLHRGVFDKRAPEVPLSGGCLRFHPFLFFWYYPLFVRCSLPSGSYIRSASNLCVLYPCSVIFCILLWLCRLW